MASRKIEFSARGIPILTLQEKLDALASCIKEVDGGYEDAAGHLCDLLEMCRLKIVSDECMMFVDLIAMVRYYGKEPTQILETIAE
jgi:hypothetical protein